MLDDEGTVAAPLFISEAGGPSVHHQHKVGAMPVCIQAQQAAPPNGLTVLARCLCYPIPGIRIRWRANSPGTPRVLDIALTRPHQAW